MARAVPNCLAAVEPVGGGIVNEMEEAVESEDDKDESEEDARNNGSDFHARKLKALTRKDKMKNTTTRAGSEEAIRLAKS